jgi:phosphoribosyl 1,2-cyclic phosphate phosphodiesterase
VDAVLFTHAHADHIAGIDEVRILNRIINRPLVAYGSANTLAEVTRRFAYAFRPWVPPYFHGPVFEAKTIAPGDEVEIAGLAVRVFAQNHGRIDTLGLRIGGFGYSTDVVGLSDEAFTTLQGVDTWVVDCFQRRGPHWTHADLGLVETWVARLKPRRTVLTHMGTEMDWAWMQANLPPGIEAGFDGMVLRVGDAPGPTA